MCAGDLQSSEEEAVVSQTVPEVVRGIALYPIIRGHNSDTTTADAGAWTWFEVQA